MSTVLQESQVELVSSDEQEADGVLMGLGTDINVRTIEFGEADSRNYDAALPMGDGIRFGRDFYSGRLISLELNAWSTPGSDAVPSTQALGVLDRLESAWGADRIRAVPGAVCVLRWRAGGRNRRVYGRPRRFAAVSSKYHVGNIPVVADFQAVDHLYYSDDLKANSVGDVPATGGGALAPFEFPLLFSSPGAGTSGTIIVGGSRPTWPVITIRGPITNPSVLVPNAGEVKLNTTLAYDQSMVIDTRPWSRGVRRENGANYAGVVDTRATPLSQFRLYPGSWQVVLKGTDLTGTALLTVEWRDAYSSF